MKHLILGLGSIGKRHYANLKRLRPDDEIITIDPFVPEASYSYLEQHSLVADSVVYICSPTESHLSLYTAMALNGARAVFVEKPLCLASQKPFDDFPTIPFAVGYCYRFHPQIEHLRQFQGRLKYLSFFAQDNLRDRYGNTALETMASHSIDAALFCAGPAKSWNTTNYDNGNRVAINILHETDCVTQIYANISLNPRESTCRFCLDRSHMRALDIDRFDPMYESEMVAWLNYVETGNAGNLCTLEQAIQVQRIMAGR